MNDAYTNGILWVNPAGNDQHAHALIQWRDGDGDKMLDWAGSSNNVNQIGYYSAGSEINVFLVWNSWPTTAQDFDLYLFRWTGSTWTDVAGFGGQDGQTGSEPPSEYIHVASAPYSAYYGVVVVKYSATSSPYFILRSPNEWLEYTGYNTTNPMPGSIGCPADASGAWAVGAIDWSSYATGPVETYSSLGPNNAAYTGGSALTKPDICGPDATASVTYPSFYGTSASSPHLAGAAALVKCAYPSYSALQIRAFLEGRAMDMGTAGKDNTYGWGRSVLGAPPPRGVVNLALASRGSTITGSNGAKWTNLIDGVTTGYTGSTGWGSTVWTSTPPGTMTLDLKGLCTISSMSLLLWDRDSRYYRYKIEASSDNTTNNTTWTTIVDRTSGEWRSWQDVGFSPAIQARYLRLTGTYNSSNEAFHVVEWEVYGAPLTPAILTSADAVTVPEGSNATFQVKLNTAPTNPTTVTVSWVSGDTDITVQSGGSLVFNAGNWNTYQPVTLAAAEDADEVNGSAMIQCSAPGLANKDVTATEQDNDVVNLALVRHDYREQRRQVDQPDRRRHNRLYRQHGVWLYGLEPHPRRHNDVGPERDLYHLPHEAAVVGRGQPVLPVQDRGVQ